MLQRVKNAPYAINPYGAFIFHPSVQACFYNFWFVLCLCTSKHLCSHRWKVFTFSKYVDVSFLLWVSFLLTWVSAFVGKHLAVIPTPHAKLVKGPKLLFLHGTKVHTGWRSKETKSREKNYARHSTKWLTDTPCKRGTTHGSNYEFYLVRYTSISSIVCMFFFQYVFSSTSISICFSSTSEGLCFAF